MYILYIYNLSIYITVFVYLHIIYTYVHIVTYVYVCVSCQQHAKGHGTTIAGHFWKPNSHVLITLQSHQVFRALPKAIVVVIIPSTTMYSIQVLRLLSPPENVGTKAS